MDIVPSLVRLDAKNAAILFCYRFFPDETSSKESLFYTAIAAKFLERLDAVPLALIIWKGILNHPKADVDQLALALLSFYLQGEKSLAIIACHKTLSHPDAEPWHLDYIADAFVALEQYDSATKTLHLILRPP